MEGGKTKKLQEVERTTFDLSCAETRPDNSVVKPGSNEVEGLTYLSSPSSVQKKGFHELQSA